MEAGTRRVAPAVVRITAGLLWFVNVDWKVPPDFGRAAGRGLARFVQLGIDHPVFPPYSWFLEHVVLPNLTAFGWLTLLIEASLAALLLSGTLTRLAALGGIAQSSAIALSVMNAPGEWYWSYLLMMAVHVAIFAMGAGKVWGVDGLILKARSAASVPGGAAGGPAVALRRSVGVGRIAVAGVLATYGLVVIALQREHPFLTASYPNSGFALFKGAMALGVVIVGVAALVAATAGRAWGRAAGLALLALAVTVFVLYRAPVNVLSATPSTAAMLAGTSAFLLVSGGGRNQARQPA
jgi:thiosulfate dehydrogenase [quinone] large subunit